ncbi:hypothetical protein [Pseudomonas sp. EA_15y_Pfl1_P102]|uniref:hypothetical protein n=1 Tax=Pseudomonas sp. EA_15y_Pfl1_P102 TaxID=3088685 RepID=UPI0030DBBFBD
MSTFAIGSSARSHPIALQLSKHPEKDTSLLTAFDAPERGFGEHYNASSHSAVIKLMMLTFGERPGDMFSNVRSNGDGYEVTMKDGYRLHLSRQELQRAGGASRFTGQDNVVLGSANFALAVFIKRKQLGSGSAADLPSFTSVLTQSLQGETTFNMLKGMGLSGHFQYLPTAAVVGEGGKGVVDSYDAGSALIYAGKVQRFGRQSSPDRTYMYTLVNDSAPKPPRAPAPVSPIVMPKVEQVTTSVRPQVAEVLQGFTAASRAFGEVFDLSSHAAVIKMMMLRFGQSPSEMFNNVETTENGYSVTMKDGFEVTLSTQELQRTTEASRFTGPDAHMVIDANFMLAAFTKRKQVERNAQFEAALLSTLRGEHTYNVLKGMGLTGFLRVVPPDKLRDPTRVGVTPAFSYSSALVVDGIKHREGEKQAIVKDYGYQLAADVARARNAKPAQFPAPPVGVKPVDIWGGFYQGVEGNCVTVSAIKAAMMKYGQNPLGIFKRVDETPDGFTVTMRDGCTVRLTYVELEMARAAANFYGTDKGLVEDAVFLYAASAKRAQLEDHEFRAGAGFDVALKTLNDGEVPGDALRRLGLYAFTRQSSVQELASGVPGTLANFGHSVVVVDGAVDEYGAKRDLNHSRWMEKGGHALKLV